jgi:hypothetical protein
MWVFIKGLPDEISVKVLRKLITRQVSPLWSYMPVKGVKVEECKVLKIMHSNSKTWESYGLVYISPSRLAHAVVGRLNVKKFKGKQLQAHPYIKRHRNRDRRKLSIVESVQYPGERRSKDRRHGNLVSQISDRLGKQEEERSRFINNI